VVDLAVTPPAVTRIGRGSLEKLGIGAGIGAG
jgi:hypothetical protein